MNNLFKMLRITTFICLLTSSLTQAQSADPSGQQRIETESIVIVGGQATPSKVSRKQGKFFLLLVSKDVNIPALAIVSSASGNTQASIDQQGLRRHGRASILLNLASGQYQLQSASGTVYCQLSITE